MGLQETIYHLLAGHSDPLTADAIAAILNESPENGEKLGQRQVANACNNLRMKNLIYSPGRVLSDAGKGLTNLWAACPGVEYKTGLGNGTTRSAGARTRKVSSTHPGVLRFRAAMDELMNSFVALEKNIVNDSDLKALQQFKSMAKHFTPPEE